MNVKPEAFQSLILQEFLLEDGLRQEFQYAEVTNWLGEILSEPAGIAVEHFLSGGVLGFVNAGLAQRAFTKLVQVKNTTLILRAAADWLASLKSPEDNYKSCCRSALCYAIQDQWEYALGALRMAEHKNKNGSQHRHISGLIHGAQGGLPMALTELRAALESETKTETKQRIEQAIEWAGTGTDVQI